VSEAFSAPFAPLSDGAIASLLAKAWGMEGAIWSAFGSERDDTLRVTAGDDEFVLKVAHPADDPARLNRQIALMNFVGHQALPFATQTTLKTLAGESTATVNGRLAHLLPFLPGTPIRHSPQGPEGVRAIGAAVFVLQQAMAAYPDPHDTDHPWALGSLRIALHSIDVVTPDSLRDGCRRLLDQAMSSTLPRLQAMPSQPTHNDAHTDNVLMDGQRVVGVVDWGDSITQPPVADLAVAASYARGYHPMWREGDPWLAATTLREGYLQAGGPDDEFVLFAELVLSRLAQRIVLNLQIASSARDGGVYARRNMVNSVRDLEEMFVSRPEGVFPGLGREPLW
jgi:hydroxylysine kinase